MSYRISQRSLPVLPCIDLQEEPYDWIDEREEKTLGKGRPYKVYSLKVNFKEIINQLETERKAIEEEKVNIERLKKSGKK